MPTQDSSQPAFGGLDDAEARVLLQRNHVGRLGFVRDGQPDVTPVHYVFDGSWIFIRSAPGAKMEAFAHNPYVAFEVDEVTDNFSWSSVVAHGTIYVLPGDGPPVEREALERAIHALRSLVPATFTDADPTPARQIVYGVHVDRLTGRTASPVSPHAEHAPSRATKGTGRPQRHGEGT